MINTSQADRRAGTLVLKSRRQEKIFDILLAHGEKQRNNIFADPNELLSILADKNLICNVSKSDTLYYAV